MTDIDSNEPSLAAPPPEVASLDGSPPQPARRRRSRAGVVMFVVAALMIVGAIAAGVIGFQARSTASNDRERAASAIDRRHASATQAHATDAKRGEIESLAKSVPMKLADLGTALDNATAAQQHFTDVGNRSSDLFNNGDESGSAALYQSEGAAALADLTQKSAAVQQAMHDTQTALQQLQEELR